MLYQRVYARHWEFSRHRSIRTAEPPKADVLRSIFAPSLNKSSRKHHLTQAPAMMMERLWLLMSGTKPEPSFRVRIKLNSDEAIRRFDKIRTRGLQFSKREIVETCRVLERDGKLEEALCVIDGELFNSILALRDHKLGEREYLGEAVMEYEKLLVPLRVLLGETRRAMQARQDIPKGLHLRADALANKLLEKKRALVMMRKTISKDARHSAAERQGVWKWMDRIWYLGRSRKFRAVEEHHEREHLVTGIAWRTRKGCRCLDYY